MATALPNADKSPARPADPAAQPHQLAVGTRDESYYRLLMPRARFCVRQKLMTSLEREMGVLQTLQVR